MMMSQKINFFSSFPAISQKDSDIIIKKFTAMLEKQREMVEEIFNRKRIPLQKDINAESNLQVVEKVKQSQSVDSSEQMKKELISTTNAIGQQQQHNKQEALQDQWDREQYQKEDSGNLSREDPFASTIELLENTSKSLKDNNITIQRLQSRLQSFQQNIKQLTKNKRINRQQSLFDKIKRWWRKQPSKLHEVEQKSMDSLTQSMISGQTITKGQSNK